MSVCHRRPIHSASRHYGGGLRSSSRPRQAVGPCFVFRGDDNNVKRKSPLDEGFDFAKEIKAAGGGWFGRKKQDGEEEPRRGSDVRANATVGFVDGILGNASVDVSFERKVKCAKCKGEGRLPRTVIKCPACDGTGIAAEEKAVTVTIPDGGVRHNQMLRLKGQGDSGVPSPANDGDLLVTLCVLYQDEPTETTRDAEGNLFTSVSLPSTVLASGTDALPVTLVDGTKGTLKVPSETKDGAALRVRGKGAISDKSVSSSTARGDHVFVLRACD
ncbi:molecular chaperone DnaJ [Pseudoscourfieldia marina]